MKKKFAQPGFPLLLTIAVLLFILTFFSCGGKRVDYGYTRDYVYTNVLKESVQINLRNRAYANVKLDYTIGAGDSVHFRSISMGGPPPPFTGQSADSVVLRFRDGSCVHYVRTQNSGGAYLGAGVFNLENYLGYQIQKYALGQRLKYEIGEKDYQEANPCP